VGKPRKTTKVSKMHISESLEDGGDRLWVEPGCLEMRGGGGRKRRTEEEVKATETRGQVGVSWRKKKCRACSREKCRGRKMKTVAGGEKQGRRKGVDALCK